MPTDIEGTPIWHDTIVGPANDDDIDAASVNDAFTLLQDNCKWLKQRIAFPLGFTSTITIGDIADTFAHTYAFDTPPEIVVDADDSTIQLHFQCQAIDLASVYSLALVLLDSGTPVYTGQANVLEGMGGASSCVAYFEGVDAGTYEVRLIVTDVSGAGHTSKAYDAVMVGIKIGDDA